MESGLCGVMGIIKQRERAVLVFITSAIGLWIVTFLLGELFGPDY